MNIFSFTPVDRFRPELYPKLYLVDKVWPIFGNDKMLVEEFSERIPSTKPIPQPLPNEDRYHGRRTLLTINNIAYNIPSESITFVSSNRKGATNNIPEAIAAILFAEPLPGAVVVVSISTITGNSVVTDKFICAQLKKLADIGYTVIVSAANKKGKIKNYERMPEISCISDTIVAAGYNKNKSAPSSNYGNGVTCYVPVPVQTSSEATADFGQSSGAAAYVAGLVMCMQYYARTKGRYMTPKEVKAIISKYGALITLNAFDGVRINGIEPEFGRIKSAIDSLFSNPSK